MSHLNFWDKVFQWILNSLVWGLCPHPVLGLQGHTPELCFSMDTGISNQVFMLAWQALSWLSHLFSSPMSLLVEWRVKMTTSHCQQGGLRCWVHSEASEVPKSHRLVFGFSFGFLCYCYICSCHSRVLGGERFLDQNRYTVISEYSSPHCETIFPSCPIRNGSGTMRLDIRET